MEQAIESYGYLDSGVESSLMDFESSINDLMMLNGFLESDFDFHPIHVQNKIIDWRSDVGTFVKSSIQDYVAMLTKKKNELDLALSNAVEFQESLDSMNNLLIDIQKELDGTKPCSTVTGAALVQIEELSAIQGEIAEQKEAILSLRKKAEVLESSSKIQDGVYFSKFWVEDLYYQWIDVTNNAALLMWMLEDGYKKAKGFVVSCNELSAWCDETERKLNDIGLSLTRDPRKIKQMFAAAEQFQKEINTNMDIYTALMETAELEKYRGENIDASTFQQMRCDIQARWRSVCQKCIYLQQRLDEEDFVLPKQFVLTAEALADWQSKVNVSRMLDSPIDGHLDTVKLLSNRHQKFEEELNNRMAEMKQVRELGKDLMCDANKDERAAIVELLVQLDRGWERITRVFNVYSTRLGVALAKAEALNNDVGVLLQWAADARVKLIDVPPIRDDRQEIVRLTKDHEKFMDEILNKEVIKNEAIALANEILENCHPDAEATIHHWIATVEKEWGTVVSLANRRKKDLLERYVNLERMISLLDDLLPWLASSETVLLSREADPMPDDLPTLNKLVSEHSNFLKKMMDEARNVKGFLKPASTLSYEEQPGDDNHSLSNGSSTDEDDTQRCDPKLQLFWDLSGTMSGCWRRIS